MMDKSLKQNILKGSAATSIGTISGMLFQFLTIMVMTRYVAKDDFGIYVLIIVIVNMFNLLGGLGLDLTMVKSIASDNAEEKQDVLFPVLILRSIGLLLFSLIFFLTSKFILHYFDDRIQSYIWYIIVIFILANFRDLFYNLLQGLNQFKNYSIVNVASSFFRTLVVLVFILIGTLTLKNLLIIEILSTLQPLLHQIIIIPFKKLLQVKPTVKTFKRVSKFSLPLYLNNLVVFLNGQVNVIIIGAFLAPASIANYDVASKVPDALRKIFRSFIVVYFPNLAKLFSQGQKDTAIKLIEKSLGVFSIAMTFIISFAFLFRKELTLLLFSQKYFEISFAFALLIFIFFIRGLGDLMGYSFVPAGHPSVPAKVNTIGSIISLGLSLILVPIWGYMGAVYSLLVMNIITSLQFYFYLIRDNINPNLTQVIKPATLLLILPFSLFFTGSLSFIMNIALFIVSVILSWFLIDDIKKMTSFLIIKARRLILANKSV